jgi:sec-independent protein translocase protein TatC
LTPPDVITQCMMAVPLILLYEIGILVSVMARKKKEEKLKAEENGEKEVAR